jgi:hypothetical protein
MYNKYLQLAQIDPKNKLSKRPDDYSEIWAYRAKFLKDRYWLTEQLQPRLNISGILQRTACDASGLSLADTYCFVGMPSRRKTAMIASINEPSI